MIIAGKFMVRTCWSKAPTFHTGVQWNKIMPDKCRKISISLSISISRPGVGKLSVSSQSQYRTLCRPYCRSVLPVLNSAKKVAMGPMLNEWAWLYFNTVSLMESEIWISCNFVLWNIIPLISPPSFGNTKPCLALGYTETGGRPDLACELSFANPWLPSSHRVTLLKNNPPKCSIRDTFLSFHNPEQFY